MSTTEVYDKILEELEGGQLSEIERKVFECLNEHRAGVTRRELIWNVFRVHLASYEDLSKSTEDRKIRKAIESLRNRLVPIVSSSGEAGYRLDTSREAVQSMMNEWRSRIDQLTVRLNAAAKFYQMPEYYQESAQAGEQLSLFG